MSESDPPSSQGASFLEHMCLDNVDPMRSLKDGSSPVLLSDLLCGLTPHWIKTFNILVDSATVTFIQNGDYDGHIDPDKAIIRVRSAVINCLKDCIE